MQKRLKTLSLGHKNKLILGLQWSVVPKTLAKTKKKKQRRGGGICFGGPVDAQLQIHPKDTSKMCASCRLLWEMPQILGYSDTTTSATDETRSKFLFRLFGWLLCFGMC